MAKPSPDPLAPKRAHLAGLLNAYRDTDYYTADNRDLLNLPESELDRLIDYYGGPIRLG